MEEGQKSAGSMKTRPGLELVLFVLGPGSAVWLQGPSRTIMGLCDSGFQKLAGRGPCLAWRGPGLAVVYCVCVCRPGWCASVCVLPRLLDSTCASPDPQNGQIQGWLMAQWCCAWMRGHCLPASKRGTLGPGHGPGTHSTAPPHPVGTAGQPDTATSVPECPKRWELLW